jgi:hypothetical protein
MFDDKPGREIVCKRCREARGLNTRRIITFDGKEGYARVSKEYRSQKLICKGWGASSISSMTHAATKWPARVLPETGNI